MPKDSDLERELQTTHKLFSARDANQVMEKEKAALKGEVRALGVEVALLKANPAEALLLATEEGIFVYHEKWDQPVQLHDWEVGCLVYHKGNVFGYDVGIPGRPTTDIVRKLGSDETWSLKGLGHRLISFKHMLLTKDKGGLVDILSNEILYVPGGRVEDMIPFGDMLLDLREDKSLLIDVLTEEILYDGESRGYSLKEPIENVVVQGDHLYVIIEANYRDLRPSEAKGKPPFKALVFDKKKNLVDTIGLKKPFELVSSGGRLFYFSYTQGYDSDGPTVKEFPSEKVIGLIVKKGEVCDSPEKIVCCNGIVYHIVDHDLRTCACYHMAYETATGNKIANAHDMISIPMSIAKNLLKNAKR